MSLSKIWLCGIVLLIIGNVDVLLWPPSYLSLLRAIGTPLIFYCILLDYRHTTNKKKFFSTLIASNLAWGALFILNLKYPLIFGTPFLFVDTNANILGSLLATCAIIWLIEMYNTKTKKVIVLTCIMIISQLVFLPIFIYIFNSLVSQGVTDSHLQVLELISALLTVISLWFNAGGLFYVVMGLIIYFTMLNKRLLFVSYSAFCLLYFVVLQFRIIPRLLTRLHYMIRLSSLPQGVMGVLTAMARNLVGSPAVFMVGEFSHLWDNYSWAMIFALVFMLLHNDGICSKHTTSKVKYAFFVSYPVILAFVVYLG